MAGLFLLLTVFRKISICKVEVKKLLSAQARYLEKPRDGERAIIGEKPTGIERAMNAE